MKRAMLSMLLGLAACQQQTSNPSADSAPVQGTDTAATEGAETATPRPSTHRLPAPPFGRVSQYSSLGNANCQMVEESDEGPYWRMHCGGVGGYSVDYTESDLRQNITVRSSNGEKTSLDLPSRVGKGAFNRLGQKIEWRGEAAEVPDSLIVRVHVANDQGEDDGGHLAVARLAPTPCLIGIVGPQRGQNAQARAIADKGGSCV